ncbi:TPA: hypothetical protein GDO54_018564 [Pyxicephalus adspersus]|uniref:Uncharacterized protein n=1 Tax=Pyxicephalus adspersus TaxID=30357 RepID=A0AAV2ZJ50_PYXAD|nr:TPA: hypothetical protein GDO54_018564 [Pyxicephalus adspersus]
MQFYTIIRSEPLQMKLYPIISYTKRGSEHKPGICTRYGANQCYVPEPPSLSRKCFLCSSMAFCKRERSPPSMQVRRRTQSTSCVSGKQE